MSMLLMVQAMRTKIGNPIRKLVLIKLADNANDDGICWPSYGHIADQCEIDRSTAMRHVKWMKENGFLSIQYRKDDERGNKSNVYRIQFPSGTEQQVVAQSSHPSGIKQPPLVAQCDPEPANHEPINEPVIINNHVGKSATVKKQKLTANDLFNEFKNHWPLIAQCDDEILHAWCQVRINKKAEHTELAHKAIEHELSILGYHGLTVTQAIREAAANGWKGLKASWYDVVKCAGNAKPVDNYRTADAAIKRLNDTSWAE